MTKINFDTEEKRLLSKALSLYVSDIVKNMDDLHTCAHIIDKLGIELSGCDKDFDIKRYCSHLKKYL